MNALVGKSHVITSYGRHGRHTNEILLTIRVTDFMLCHLRYELLVSQRVHISLQHTQQKPITDPKLAENCINLSSSIQPTRGSETA